jgi:hypothetical protein
MGSRSARPDLTPAAARHRALIEAGRAREAALLADLVTPALGKVAARSILTATTALSGWGEGFGVPLGVSLTPSWPNTPACRR